MCAQRVNMMRVLIVINIHVLHLLNLAKGLGPTALPAAGTAAKAATGRRSSQFASSRLSTPELMACSNG